MGLEGVDVLGTVRDACTIHPMVYDYRMTEAIENLSDLIGAEREGTEFFARNYVTQGMDTLFREGLLRLAGRPPAAMTSRPRTWRGSCPTSSRNPGARRRPSPPSNSPATRSTRS